MAYEDAFVAVVDDFKNRLHRKKELIRDFALKHGWKPGTFRAALARDGNMQTEMRQAILDYIEADRKAQSKEV